MTAQPFALWPDPDEPLTECQALTYDGHQLHDLPSGVTLEILERLISAQDQAEHDRVPMPTLKGWLAVPPTPVDPWAGADQPIDLWHGVRVSAPACSTSTCDLPAATNITTACVHEHVATRAVCGLHREVVLLAVKLDLVGCARCLPVEVSLQVVELSPLVAS